MQTIFEQFTTYLTALDWTFILTFILLSYAFSYYKVCEFINRFIKIKMKTRYRVLLIGLVYGILTFFIRGYNLQRAEMLFQSFLFAVVFHKMLLEQFTTKFLSKPKKTTSDEVA